MKNVKILLILLVCVVLTGCSNSFAQKEYSLTEKIVENEDRYAKENSVFNSIEGGYSLEVTKFDGRETLWSKIIEEDKEIELKIRMSLSDGTAKIVHIDEDDNVTTIIECTPESTTDGYITQTVPLKIGLNRIKIVGKGCRDIELELLSSDF